MHIKLIYFCIYSSQFRSLLSRRLPILKSRIFLNNSETSAVGSDLASRREEVGGVDNNVDERIVPERVLPT